MKNNDYLNPYPAPAKQEKKPQITNTTRRAVEDPLAMLFEMAVGGSSRAIEKMEAEGQKELVKSEVLPTDVDEDSKLALKAAGVVFGKPVPGDSLFCEVTLPDGWSKVRTGHSMWSNLVDDKGRVRAHIFYKSAFYDRAAHMNATRRFASKFDYDTHTATVTDGETKVIYRTKATTVTGEDYENRAERDQYRKEQDSLEKEAEIYLNATYPNWKGLTAYWNEP